MKAWPGLRQIAGRTRNTERAERRAASADAELGKGRGRENTLLILPRLVHIHRLEERLRRRESTWWGDAAQGK